MSRLSNFKGYIRENKMSSWELDSKIEKIINSNIKEVPYEGLDIDKYGIKSSFLDLIYELCPEYRPKNSWDEDE